MAFIIDAFTGVPVAIVKRTGDTMTGGLIIAPSAVTTTALQVGNPSTTPLLQVDTQNNIIRLGAPSTSPAPLNTGGVQVVPITAGQPLALTIRGTRNNLGFSVSNETPGEISQMAFYTSSATGLTNRGATFRDSVNGVNWLNYVPIGLVGIGTSTPTLTGTGKLHITGDRFRLETSFTPAASGVAGNPGEIAWDANYIYVCVALNTWRRLSAAMVAF